MTKKTASKLRHFFSTTQTSTKSAFLLRIAISSFYDGCTFDLLNKVIIFAICRNLFQVLVKVFHAYYSDQIWLLISRFSPLFLKWRRDSNPRPSRLLMSWATPGVKLRTYISSDLAPPGQPTRRYNH